MLVESLVVLHRGEVVQTKPQGEPRENGRGGLSNQGQFPFVGTRQNTSDDRKGEVATQLKSSVPRQCHSILTAF